MPMHGRVDELFERIQKLLNDPAKEKRSLLGEFRRSELNEGVLNAA